MTRFIFVTGGVVSSVGKGITVASIGRMLKSRDISVSVLKLDPYLNVDPGTMSPYQHGEVFVTNDGSETDLDLGHYERFIDVELTELSNLTAGQIYSEVIAKERRGEFLGGTIQAVPHVTDAIKKRMHRLAEESKADAIVVEVGGTVGDIEGLPFLEAIRQMRNEAGRDNVFYIHVTYLPYIGTTGEIKTKPTQHSVRELRSIGIQPDAIVCRSEHEVTEDIKDKISVHCDVFRKGVIALPTVSTVYEVPLVLEQEGLGELIVETLKINAGPFQLTPWAEMVQRMHDTKEIVQIGVVGKYVDLPDSYISVREALYHAGLFHNSRVELKWIHAEEIEKNGPGVYLDNMRGIVVPGGFGPRGIEGMISTVKYARENDVPYLGLCLGMQVMVIEAARTLLQLDDANSTEFNDKTSAPVIDLMTDQKDVTEMGGTMRLGQYPCDLLANSWAYRAYGREKIFERHRHRYEVNNAYRKNFEAVNIRPTGVSPDGKLVEIMEYQGSGFMVGVQFHPEFLSRPDAPHPLFREFLGKAVETLREGGQHYLPLT